MPDTSLGISAETKQRFDAAKPDGTTTDEFVRELLNDATIRPKRYVEADAVMEAIDATRTDEEDLKRALRDVLAEGRV